MSGSPRSDSPSRFRILPLPCRRQQTRCPRRSPQSRTRVLSAKSPGIRRDRVDRAETAAESDDRAQRAERLSACHGIGFVSVFPGNVGQTPVGSTVFHNSVENAVPVFHKACVIFRIDPECAERNSDLRRAFEIFLTPRCKISAVLLHSRQKTQPRCSMRGRHLPCPYTGLAPLSPSPLCQHPSLPDKSESPVFAALQARRLSYPPACRLHRPAPRPTPNQARSAPIYKRLSPVRRDRRCGSGNTFRPQ